MADVAYYWADKAGRAEIAKKHTAEMKRKYANEIATSAIRCTTYSPFKRNDTKDLVKSMEVILMPEGTVDAIFSPKAEGKIAALNFASYRNPGGRFIDGSRAQEESLCHESFLYNVLIEHPEYYSWNEQNRNYGLYLDRALYSPGITFERNRHIVHADVITCAAPNIAADRKYSHRITEKQNREALESRCRFVLDVAREQKVDTLILGAFGCGVFGQDATEVATIFTDLLKTTHKCFKKVIFAVPEDVHSQNYNSFKKVLEKK